MAITKDAIDAGLERGHTIDITTTGRRTGKARRIEIVFHNIGGRIEIVFHNIGGRIYISGLPRTQKRDWLLNLEADPHFTFHLKGRTRADLPAVARVIDDEAERRDVLPHVARNWRRNDLEQMVRYSPLIEVAFPQ
ncbi:MAG TPA: nitroreductase/quinone reductase family protein [Candidatus Dormibacteraeota bacterium]